MSLKRWRSYSRIADGISVPFIAWLTHDLLNRNSSSALCYFGRGNRNHGCLDVTTAFPQGYKSLLNRPFDWGEGDRVYDLVDEEVEKSFQGLRYCAYIGARV